MAKGWHSSPKAALHPRIAAATSGSSCAVVIFVITASRAAGKPLNFKSWSPPIRALAAVSLSRDPLADVGRTMSKLDALSFVDREELHGVTVDQLEFSELDGDDTAVIERGAKYVQVLACNPPNDTQHQTLASRKSVDSACHVTLARLVVQ